MGRKRQFQRTHISVSFFFWRTKTTGNKKPAREGRRVSKWVLCATSAFESSRQKIPFVEHLSAPPCFHTGPLHHTATSTPTVTATARGSDILSSFPAWRSFYEFLAESV
jgi:hypothetical protein